LGDSFDGMAWAPFGWSVTKALIGTGILGLRGPSTGPTTASRTGTRVPQGLRLITAPGLVASTTRTGGNIRSE
jgi:hypothetical protein